METINIIASIASIISAIYTAYLAVKVKKSSQIVEDAKNEVLAKTHTAELNLLRAKANDIMSKFSLLKNEKSLKSRGADRKTYGLPIDEFINTIATCQSRVNDKLRIILEDIANQLTLLSKMPDEDKTVIISTTLEIAREITKVLDIEINKDMKR